MNFSAFPALQSSQQKNIFLYIGKLLTGTVLAAVAVWCVGVARFVWHFSTVETVLFAVSLAVVWTASCFVCRAWWMLAVIEGMILLSFLLLTPERRFASERWSVECRRVPELKFLPDGKVAISNIRNFRYRTAEDFDIRYKNDVFDPEKLASLDIALSYWYKVDLVAHMLLCFNFRDGRKLAVSFEPRVPDGKKGGSFFLGIYRQYGRMMLFAAPEDIFDLRSRYRGETLYIYRCAVNGAELKNIFLHIANQAEEIMHKNGFYHSITDNCTTGFREALRHSARLEEFDLRWIFNGLFDRYLFEKGFLERRNGESFGSLKSRSFVPGLCSGTESKHNIH